MKAQTAATKLKTITRGWHFFDVKNQTLGRITNQIALKLMGKSKPYYVTNLDCGDHVVVVNARQVRVTGHKDKEKLYGKYSGYPGGLKQKAFWQVQKENPGLIIRNAVMGMLPKNKLRDRLITRLYVFPDEKHPFEDKFRSK